MRILLKIVITVAVACLLAASNLAHPGSGILVDRLGQIYFIDTGSGLWKVDTKGVLSHLSPLRNHWLAMDQTDRFTQSSLPTDAGRDWEITAAGSSPTILISTDFPIVIGHNGDLYHPSARETNVRIMRTSPTGGTSAFVTLPRSVAGAPLGWINGLAIGPDRSLYYSEDNAVRRITAKGEVSTVATVPPLTNGPNIPGSDSRPYLRGLTVDDKGVVYVADSADARVLKITPDGKLSTIIQLESAVITSLTASLAACTEILNLIPYDLTILEILEGQWDALRPGSLLARSIWELRASSLLPKTVGQQ